ncbi:hypothetical protein MOMA_06921 [Moraxella macacae 0408225]|uniref:Uncharacterized protein n=1 Tax=Moraxella macacae 0408225 TaxID=1230338 RepID=L2F5E3_9GAMM|nr:hypothetical protein [Moraxella macacae]ELA08274.1 hypothetical protein MOMA_06921 [Moraxella macacae 0408225]
MAIKLTQPEINWFASEYTSGRTLEEMAIDVGCSKQNVKRALAEAGIYYLTWYKTKQEDLMLKHLRQKGITNINQLKGVI